MRCDGKLVNLGSDFYHYRDQGIAGPVALLCFQRDMCAAVRVQARCDPALCEGILAEVRKVPCPGIAYLRGVVRNVTEERLRDARPDDDTEDEPCPEIYQHLFRLP